MFTGELRRRGSTQRTWEKEKGEGCHLSSKADNIGPGGLGCREDFLKVKGHSVTWPGVHGEGAGPEAQFTVI